MKTYQTKWSELQFTHIKAYNVTHKRMESFWTFLNEGHRVGKAYPTREMLIADMPRYAADAWGLN